ncbi:dTMP kinase [Vibrio breoganii]
MYFIVIDGVDGTGKTSQLGRLNDLLSQRQDVIQTREPGGSPFGEMAREAFLKDRDTMLSPMAQLSLLMAGRYIHLADVIEPAIAADKIVLCDRYIPATYAHQIATSFDAGLIHAFEAMQKEIRKPDLTIILDLSFDERIERLNKRREKEGSEPLNHLDIASLDRETAEQLRIGFLDYASYNLNHVVIDASGTEEEVFNKIVNALIEHGIYNKD